MMSKQQLLYLVVTFCSLYPAQTRQPSNITRSAGETDVFIPCPFEFRPAPSIWRINGKDYTATTLPSIYSFTPGGLFISTADPCLNQTSFQCIDTSDSLQAQESSIGFLTVTSPGPEECDLQSYDTLEAVRIDHHRSNFGRVNTTLAWSVYTAKTYCNLSQVVSYPPCQRNSVDVNLTTTSMEVTIPSEKLRLSGELADFNVSITSDQNCPKLYTTVRINVTEVEHLNLTVLHGNISCYSTCVNIDCSLGSLNVAISNPGPDMDILCPVYFKETCYSPDTCSDFDGSPFFNICVNEQDNTSCSLCFRNISEQHNGTKLNFYREYKNICPASYIYMYRVYELSFEIQVREASVNISFYTNGEICFSSSPEVQECDLTHFTKYNVSLADLTGNILFINESIPESSCVITKLLPVCSPFSLLVQPFNEHLVYRSSNQQIVLGGSGDLCNCLKENVQLHFDVTPISQNSSIAVSYFCSSVYLSSESLELTLLTNVNNKKNDLRYQSEILCANGSFSISSNQCDACSIEVCAYRRLTNGFSCQLECSSLNVPTQYPTMSPTNSDITLLLVGIIIGAAFIVIAGTLALVSVYIQCRRPTKKKHDIVPKTMRIKRINTTSDEVDINSYRDASNDDNDNIIITHEYAMIKNGHI